LAASLLIHLILFVASWLSLWRHLEHLAVSGIPEEINMFGNHPGKFLWCGLACALLSLTVNAQTKYTYTYFAANASKTGVFVTAINNAGDVVGLHDTTVSGQTVAPGFERLTTGKIVQVVDPDSNDGIDRANGINNKGEITGDYLNDNGGTVIYQGYEHMGGKFINYSVAAGDATDVYGLNDRGDFVG
jgi:hypothetical protein